MPAMRNGTGAVGAPAVDSIGSAANVNQDGSQSPDAAATADASLVPIIAGSVGGVCCCVLLALLLVCLVRRRRDNDNAADGSGAPTGETNSATEMSHYQSPRSQTAADLSFDDRASYGTLEIASQPANIGIYAAAPSAGQFDSHDNTAFESARFSDSIYSPAPASARHNEQQYSPMNMNVADDMAQYDAY